MAINFLAIAFLRLILNEASRVRYARVLMHRLKALVPYFRR